MTNTQSPAPGVAAERQRFEATFAKLSPGCDFSRASNDTYANRYVEHNWQGWNAALQASAAAVEPAYYQYLHEGQWANCSKSYYDHLRQSVGYEVRMLYTAPPLPAQVQAAEDEMAISAAMSEGNKHGVKSFVAAKIVAAYLASRTPAPGMPPVAAHELTTNSVVVNETGNMSHKPGMAGGVVPPDCIAEWPEHVRTLYLTARTSSGAQGIPSHALDAMRAILLAAPHPAPAQQAAGAEGEPS